VTEALTRFAEAATQAAIRLLLAAAAEKGDLEPPHQDDAARDSGLAVIGMGKLGARELNYSSDIDLIVLFDQEVVRYRGKETAQRCFVRLTQGLARLLQEPTADGYVLRVDLRLRPDPGATPPALSMQAAEGYYESMGQNWERAAFIKARPVAGDLAAGAGFLDRLKPFIWRRNLDFASIADVQSIKRQIHSHKGGGEIAIEGHDVKLGRGGIRDIEFFAQTQQLIAGGRDPSLRDATTCGALAALSRAGWIGEAARGELEQAYVFHRTLEHRLQMIADEQTHALPRNAEAVDHVARFMGYGEPDRFRADFLDHARRVQSHWVALFESAPTLSGEAGSLVFTGTEDDPDTLATLKRMGYRTPSGVAATVRGWHHGRYRAMRSSRAREIMTTLVPLLLQALAKTADPDGAFARFDRFMAGLPGGVQLLSLLQNNPGLLELIAEIMGSGPRLADELSRNASVLDAVLSEDFLAPLPPRAELERSLMGALAVARDFQDRMDAVRRFVKERKFQLGAQILGGMRPAEACGGEYADLADAAIAQLYPVVEAEFAERHGRVPGGGMAIAALGKLGGREMTASSDLDLVFVYDFPEEVALSDGEKGLPPVLYYTRLSQRFIGALTAQTGEGGLYEVDMRLRPSGNKGPVATRLPGFVAYHERESWTWEHMALTRARLLAGPPALSDAVRQAIDATLRRPRDARKTAADVVEMRARIQAEKRTDDPWETKQVRGGLVDLEFIAQYLQLLHPQALDPNTGEAFAKLAACGALAAEAAAELRAALTLIRNLTGLLRVALEGDFKPAQAPDGLRRALAKAAAASDFAEAEGRLIASEAAVLAHFRSIVEAAAGRD
jgi:glutamate-ammonia-ligase adenylyltransferase